MKPLQSFLLFLQIYLCCFIGITEEYDAIAERASLVIFKSVVSDSQNTLQSWTQNTSHCTWLGVSCSIKGARVRSLNLSGLGLSGPIPYQLSNLTSLFMLNLSNNSFYGHIPTEIDRLSHLQILDFSKNNLTGVIPVTLGNLTSLTNLILTSNQLQGEIPSELGHLRNLLAIELSVNQLIGEIPRSLNNISSLVSLSATDNNLTGKLPSDLGSALPNLKVLYLAQNMLGGILPSSLFNLSHLEKLDLDNNGFQGTVPLFGRMKDLLYLNLGNNFLSSSTMLNFQLIDSLGNCTQLENLMIYSNQLSGRFPSSIGNLSTHLQHFCFSDNLLTGTFPQGLENLQELISLSIEHNSFVGEIPKTLGRLSKLQRLFAFDNMLSGEIPDIFGNFTQLYQLWIGKNQLFGKIPSSIGSCHRLMILELAENRLNGSIPKEIYGLSTLVQLNLSQNSLSGSLLAEVGNLKQIEFIDVSDNKLSENISATIGSCSSLLILYMTGNNFTGSIPSDIGKLKSLQKLDLSSNSLSGRIPEELEKLEYLVNLNVSFNHLEGNVPTNGVFFNLSHDSFKGNSMLCTGDHISELKLGLPQCPAERRHRHIFLVVLLPVCIVACLFCCSICIFISRRKQKSKDRGVSLPNWLPPLISYSQIQLATDNFSPENLIGKGGFGFVYKGVFRNMEETVLAVKVLDLQQSKATRSFEAECETLKNVRHRNLVKVITCCSSIDHTGEEFKALVMEFMPQGNLDKWLYAEVESGLCLTLLERLNIAIDVASAIDYLHHDCDPPIVHCDLKPGNVLLDDDMVAHIADFGLARFVSQKSSEKGSSTDALKGSIGYIAPEYGLGGKASTSGDVYSFGILLLEIFIAKKPTNEMFIEGLGLNDFTKALNSNNVMEIADPRLFNNDGHFSSGSTTTNCSSDDHTSNSPHKGEVFIEAAIRVGLSCTSHSPKDRLTIREALTRLQKIKKSIDI